MMIYLLVSFIIFVSLLSLLFDFEFMDILFEEYGAESKLDRGLVRFCFVWLCILSSLMWILVTPLIAVLFVLHKSYKMVYED